MNPPKNFPHHMLREIYEQPQVAIRSIAEYLSPEGMQRSLDAVGLREEDILQMRRINMLASGTSRHAALAGEFMIERLARVPVKVDFASQYCYRDPLAEAGDMAIVLSQSGTTADTLAALRVAKEKGAKIISICNVRDTPIMREAHGTVLTHAGEEIAIAATKSFLAQLLALYALALHLGTVRRVLTAEESRRGVREMMELPAKIEAALTTDAACRALAERWVKADDFVFAGRDISYPIALEAALKVKETAYIHAEGFPTGELPHGPTALLDEGVPTIVITTADPADPGSELRREKTEAILQGLRDKRIPTVSVTNRGEAGAEAIVIPATTSLLSPVLEIIPLQLLAYHLAVLRGVDVDRPRNLTKSVTQ